MREQYSIFVRPKISKIYLVWDTENDIGPETGSKCIFVWVGGMQYRWSTSFARWRNLLSNVSYTHTSGIYTLNLIPNTNSISCWDHHAVFDSIESLIEDLKVRVILEAL